MKLSTKKLFKSTQKPKYSKIQKQKPSAVNSNNKINPNHTSKIGQMSSKTILMKINPFNSDNKIRKQQKHITTKLPTLQLKSPNDKNLLSDLDNNANNYFNLPNNESDSNKQIHDEEMDIEVLRNLFHSSKLNKALIMDDQGNNNIDSEQKQLIKNCIDEKDRLEKNIKNCKINSIKTQKYHENNIFSKQKNNIDKKASNLKYKKLDVKDKEVIRSSYRVNTVRNKKLNFDKNILINRKSNGFKNLIIFTETKCIEDTKNNEINKDKENNSIFENCTNKSLDSSFLGSSMADVFSQD